MAWQWCHFYASPPALDKSDHGLCMSHCVCHIVYVTLCMSHCVCHVVLNQKVLHIFNAKSHWTENYHVNSKRGVNLQVTLKQNCTKKSHKTGPARILSRFLSALPAIFNNSIWSRSYFLCLIVFNHPAIWNSVLCNYTIDSKITESSASIFLLWGTKCCPCFVMEGCIL